MKYKLFNSIVDYYFFQEMLKFDLKIVKEFLILLLKDIKRQKIKVVEKCRKTETNIYNTNTDLIIIQEHDMSG